MPSLTINGQRVTVDDSFSNLSHDEQNATVDEIAQSLSSIKPADHTPSGLIAGLQQGAANVVHGAAETAKQYLGQDTAIPEGAAKTIAPNDYQGATIVPQDGHWYDPRTYNWSQVPQAIAEAAPGMATDIAAAKAASRIPVIGKYAGPAAGVVSYLLRTRGDAAKQDAAIRTGNTNAEPETQDKVRSALTGVVESIPQAIGISRFLPGAGQTTTTGLVNTTRALSKAFATTGVEAGTSAAQNAISQAGATIGTDKGLTIDPAQVAEAAVTGGATHGLMTTPSVLSAARTSIKYRRFLGDNQEASAAFANRILKAADGATLNPANGFEAVRTADGAIRDELRKAVKPISNSIDVETADALKRAKLGRVLTDSDLSNIAANTPPDVAFLVRQAHAAALLKQLGDYGKGKFVGGVTNALGKQLRVFNNPVGFGLGSVIGGESIPHSPEMLAALAGGYAGMRGLDALTGNRSPAKSFVNRFTDPSVAPRLPSAPQVSTSTHAAAVPAAIPGQPVDTPVLPRVVSPELLRRITESTDRSAEDDPSRLARAQLVAHRLLSFVGSEDAQSEQHSNPQAETAAVEEIPTPANLLHTKVSPMDLAIARKATDEFTNAVPVASGLRAQRYFDSTAQRQARIRDRLMQISGHEQFPADNVQLGEALDQLRYTRSREAAAAHVNALATDYLSHASLIRSYFGPQWANSVWNATRK